MAEPDNYRRFLTTDEDLAWWENEGRALRAQVARVGSWVGVGVACRWCSQMMRRG